KPMSLLLPSQIQVIYDDNHRQSLPHEIYFPLLKKEYISQILPMLYESYKHSFYLVLRLFLHAFPPYQIPYYGRNNLLILAHHFLFVLTIYVSLSQVVHHFSNEYMSLSNSSSLSPIFLI